MSAACPVCMKLVLDTEEGVNCDADCERWFHRECLRMTKSEYQRISGDNNIRWSCTRTDCKKIRVDPVDTKLDAILSKLSSLATKTELSEGLNLIKQDIQLVAAKLNELEPRIDKVESEIRSLKENNAVGDQLYEDVVSECNDRNRRSKNVIIYNMVELDQAPSSREANLHDAKLITALFNYMRSETVIAEVRHFRLGKRSRGKARPLLICMPSEAAAIFIFKNFRAENVPDNMEGISISHDRTPRERKHLEQLRATLKSRQEAGEVNLTIKFVNGTPKIVSKNE